MTKFDRLCLLFWGYMIHASKDIFSQDLMGMEKYITLVVQGWIDMHWGWGLALLIVCSWAGWNHKLEHERHRP